MFKYNSELVEIAEGDRTIVEADYIKAYRAVGSSNAVYKGKQLPFLYFPAIYSKEDVQRFEQLTEDVFKMVNQSIDIYLNHPEVRDIWGFSSALESLILIEPKFKVNVPMGRFDFFYYPDGSYRFCELNTDGTSAMNEETPLTDVLIETHVMRQMRERYTVERYELYQSWVDEVKQLYTAFVENGGEASDAPYVIIMDYMSKGSPHEFEVFKRIFEANGYKCGIVSPDELVENDGYLYHEGEKVDIIYRRLVTRDMMDHYEDLTALIKGIEANKTCIIGSIRSQIVHTKKYFEALHHPIVRQYFDDEMLAYIDTHVPFTAPLRSTDDLTKYLEDKDNYIIKPIDYYASKGVYAGREFNLETWKGMLEKGAEEGYIIQDFCEKSVNKNLHIKADGSFEVSNFNNITGLFVYNEKMKGIFTRAGHGAVISDLNDGFSLSSVVI